MRKEIVNWYVLFILGIYPFLMHDGLLDISRTKSVLFVFMTGCVFYVCVGGSIFKKDWKWLSKKQNWLIYAIVVAIGISTYCSVNPEYALTGAGGRYQGALVYWSYCIAALCILNFGSYKKYYTDVIIGAGTLVSFLAIMNFYEVDILGTLGRIAEHQRHAYISTIGNINIYAAYLSVVVPVAVIKAIAESDKRRKIGYYVCTFILFCGMIVSSCDSVYITLGVLFVVLPFFGLHEYKKRIGMSEVLILFGAALLTICLLNKKLQYSLEYVDGLNLHFSNPFLVGAILLFFVLIDIFFVATKKLTKNISKKLWQRGWFLFVIVIMIIAVYVYIKNVTFDYKWGSYRGFIWSQGLDFYLNQPIKEKCFGIGLDLVYPVFYEFFGHDGMMVDGFAFYDNLHNEYLQYLVTTGIVGLILYLTAIGHSVYRLLQKAGSNADAFAVLAAALCYLVQSFTNISMCCVTAVIFVLLFTGLLIENVEKQ